MPFVKIDCGILDSSIWVESTNTRIVWITMLAMADQTGLVHATAPGIASRSRVSLSDTRIAIEVLEKPDRDSKSLEDDGRRIKRVDGGYLILNYEKYRAYNYSMKDDAVRKREYRGRVRDNVRTMSGHSASASEVLSYLNLKTGKRYRNNKEILARLRDGYTEEQLKGIVDVKVCDPYFMENSQYLNPVTLFRKSHIDNYINQKPDEFKRRATNERIRPNEEPTPQQQLMWQLESIDREIMRTTRYLEQFDGTTDDELDAPTIEKIKAARITLDEQNAEFKETQKELESLLTK